MRYLFLQPTPHNPIKLKRIFKGKTAQIKEKVLPRAAAATP